VSLDIRPKVSAVVGGGNAPDLAIQSLFALKEFPKNAISRIEPLNLEIGEQRPGSPVIFVSSRPRPSSFVLRPRVVQLWLSFRGRGTKDEDDGRGEEDENYGRSVPLFANSEVQASRWPTGPATSVAQYTSLR
jgi:hypothetical protein